MKFCYQKTTVLEAS